MASLDIREILILSIILSPVIDIHHLVLSFHLDRQIGTTPKHGFHESMIQH